jgi:hypothetical protein
MKNETVQTLRHGGSLKLWDRSNKLFIRIQLNRKENFICWERWVKKAGGNWVNWNKYLSLKDVLNIKDEISGYYKITSPR